MYLEAIYMIKTLLNKQKIANLNAHLHLGLALLLMSLVLGKVILSWSLDQYPKAQASDLSQESVLNAVNRERELRNLSLLNTNSKLTVAAQSKSDDMQARHYFSHADPDGHYIWDKIVAAGYAPYMQLGENLAIEFYDTDSLVLAWMNSPTHRANILQEGFRDQGMGLAFGNGAAGEYHSAITNAFGALAQSKPVKQQQAAPPDTQTVKQKASSPAPAAPLAKTNNPPLPAPASNTLAASEPLRPREGMPAATLAQNFILPGSAAPAATETPKAAAPGAEQAAEAVRPQLTGGLPGYQSNRYYILGAGLLLLLLLVSDIKKTVAGKLGGLDKKINNLVLLLISLLVVAFMYWL